MISSPRQIFPHRFYPTRSRWSRVASPFSEIAAADNLTRWGVRICRKLGATALALGPASALIAALVTCSASARAGQHGQGDSDKSQSRYGRNQRGLPAEGGAKSQSTLALPFKRSWAYLTSDAAGVPASVDSGRVYLSLSKGEVICLDLRSGSLLWSTDLGGRINDSIAVSARAIYLLTQKPSADQSQAGVTVDSLNNYEGSGSITALDPVTGLALWAKDYPRPFTSPPLVDKDRLYVGAADGAFYSISTGNGDVIWKVQTGDIIRGAARLSENAIFFGSDDGALREIDLSNGAEIWKYQTTGKIVSRPVLEENHLYFGSGDAVVYCVDLERKKVKWKYRTGAAIEAPLVLTGNRLLVGSLDNFIYALSKTSGDHLWKRRMENRVTYCPVVDGDTAMISSFRGDHVAMFLSGDGRRVNYYQLSKGEALVSDPVFAEGNLVLETERGLVVAVAQHSEGSKEAIKKSP